MFRLLPLCLGMLLVFAAAGVSAQDAEIIKRDNLAEPVPLGCFCFDATNKPQRAGARTACDELAESTGRVRSGDVITVGYAQGVLRPVTPENEGFTCDLASPCLAPNEVHVCYGVGVTGLNQ